MGGHAARSQHGSPWASGSEPSSGDKGRGLGTGLATKSSRVPDPLILIPGPWAPSSGRQEAGGPQPPGNAPRARPRPPDPPPHRVLVTPWEHAAPSPPHSRENQGHWAFAASGGVGGGALLQTCPKCAQLGRRLPTVHTAFTALSTATQRPTVYTAFTPLSTAAQRPTVYMAFTPLSTLHSAPQSTLAFPLSLLLHGFSTFSTGIHTAHHHCTVLHSELSHQPPHPGVGAAWLAFPVGVSLEGPFPGPHPSRHPWLVLGRPEPPWERGGAASAPVNLHTVAASGRWGLTGVQSTSRWGRPVTWEALS